MQQLVGVARRRTCLRWWRWAVSGGRSQNRPWEEPESDWSCPTTSLLARAPGSSPTQTRPSREQLQPPPSCHWGRRHFLFRKRKISRKINMQKTDERDRERLRLAQRNQSRLNQTKLVMWQCSCWGEKFWPFSSLLFFTQQKCYISSWNSSISKPLLQNNKFKLWKRDPSIWRWGEPTHEGQRPGGTPAWEKAPELHSEE